MALILLQLSGHNKYVFNSFNYSITICDKLKKFLFALLIYIRLGIAGKFQ